MGRKLSWKRLVQALGIAVAVGLATARSLPIPTVTPFNGADVRGRVIGLGFFADRALTVRAQFVDASGTPTDTGWFFTVTQP